MIKKRNISIDASLYEQIRTYCEANGLKTIDIIEGWIKKEFIIEKWGEIPSIFDNFSEPDTPDIDEKENDDKLLPSQPLEKKESNLNNNNFEKRKIRRLK